MANTFLHTCYRIGDIDSSVAFYEKLGFAEVGRMPIGDEAINVFMGLDDGDPDPRADLQPRRRRLRPRHRLQPHRPRRRRPRRHPGGRLAEDGIDPEKPPYRPGGRTTGSRIAFVRDPDGYRIELVEKGDLTE